MDGHAAAGLGAFLDRDGHGEDPVVVVGVDLVLLRADRQGDAAGERPVAELAVRLVLPLLAALGVDAQNVLVDGDVEILVGVDPGRLGANDVAAFLGVVPAVDEAPVLISIVLLVFMAFAGFFIKRCSTPLSK